MTAGATARKKRTSVTDLFGRGQWWLGGGKVPRDRRPRFDEELPEVPLTADQIRARKVAEHRGRGEYAYSGGLEIAKLLAWRNRVAPGVPGAPATAAHYDPAYWHYQRMAEAWRALPRRAPALGLTGNNAYNQALQQAAVATGAGGGGGGGGFGGGFGGGGGGGGGGGSPLDFGSAYGLINWRI